MRNQYLIERCLYIVPRKGAARTIMPRHPMMKKIAWCIVQRTRDHEENCLETNMIGFSSAYRVEIFKGKLTYRRANCYKAKYLDRQDQHWDKNGNKLAPHGDQSLLQGLETHERKSSSLSMLGDSPVVCYRRNDVCVCRTQKIRRSRMIRFDVRVCRNFGAGHIFSSGSVRGYTWWHGTLESSHSSRAV